MAQRYTQPLAQERMAVDLCPECGAPEASHLDDPRFWLPRECGLLPQGVAERIAQHKADQEGGS